MDEEDNIDEPVVFDGEIVSDVDNSSDSEDDSDMEIINIKNPKRMMMKITKL